METISLGFQTLNLSRNLFNHGSQMQEQLEQESHHRNRFPMDDRRTSAGRYGRKNPSREDYYDECSLRDLEGKVLSEAMNQHGSEFLYQQLHRRDPQDMEAIFSEVKDHVCLLMFDRFGNHVMQKLFLNCNKQQLRYLVSKLTADFHLFKAICLHSQGSRSMQIFLESCLMTEEERSHMISVLEEITILLVKDQTGVRVIQHCFNNFHDKETTPIFDVIISNCRQIAANRSGCRFLQVVLSNGIETCTEKRLVQEIMGNLFYLSMNQFGNYVVQDLIGLETPGLAAAMVYELRGKFNGMSMDKYASHVVERLMESSRGKYLSQIIDEIVRRRDCSRVILNHYGNRVVRSARKYSKGTDRKTLDHLLFLHS